MTAFGLYTALTDVDDRFILEAAETEIPKPIKRQIVQWVAIVAIAAMIITIGLLFGNSIKKHKENKSEAEKVSTIKPWSELPSYEKYPELNMNGIKYTGSPGVYSGTVGQFFGEFSVIGMDDGEVTYIGEEKIPQNGADAQKTTLSDTWIDVEKQNQTEPVIRKTTVLVYEIPGIKTAFAVAVRFPEEGRYYVYGNVSYRTDSYADFADTTQLMQYAELNGITLHSAKRERDVSGAYETIQALLTELFSAETIPAFMPEDLPSDFGGFALRPGDVTNDKPEHGTAPNYGTTTLLIVSEEVLGFLQDKELGTLCVSIGLDYHLFGQNNIWMQVYSGGFVKTNIGWSGKTFYVGKEKVASFIGTLEGN